MRCVVNATHRPLYPREKRPDTHCIRGWVGPRTGLDRCGKSRFHRGSIPGPSSPQRVAIPTGLSRPTSSSYGVQFSQFRSSKSRTLTPSSAKLTTASRWRTMRTSTTGALWPKRDIRGSLVTTGFHSLTTRSLLPVASRCSDPSR